MSEAEINRSQEKALTHAPAPETRKLTPERQRIIENTAKLTFIQQKIPRWLKSGAISAGLAVSAVITACSGGEEYHPVTKDPTVPAAGVNVVHLTETSRTATIEATRTTRPTKTPKSEKTAEVVQRRYTVIAAPGLTETSKDSNRTIEQDKAEIQKVLDLFPQIGKAKVVLTDEGHSHLVDNVIYLNRNLQSIEALKFEAAHEMTHYLDVELNGDNLSKSLTSGEKQKLKDLRKQALEDPTWGSNYTLSEILDPTKSTVHPDIIEKRYSDKEAAAATNIYPDSIFVSGQRNQETPGPQPFRNFLPSKELLNSFEQNGQRPSYNGIVSFLDAEQDKISQISATDPVMKHVFEVEQQNKDRLKLINTQWSSHIHRNAWLNGPTIGDYWHGQQNMADVILINDFLNNNQDVIKLFPPEKLTEIKNLISLRIQNADEEKFAELGKATILAGRRTSLTLYFQELNKVADRILKLN